MEQQEIILSCLSIRNVTPTTKTDSKPSCCVWLCISAPRQHCILYPLLLETRPREKSKWISPQSHRTIKNEQASLPSQKNKLIRIFPLLWRIHFGFCFQALSHINLGFWQFFLPLRFNIYFYSVPTFLLCALTCYFIYSSQQPCEVGNNIISTLEIRNGGSEKLFNCLSY